MFSEDAVVDLQLMSIPRMRGNSGANVVVDSYAEATVASSVLRDDPDKHYLVVDIDHPCLLTDSQTSGHHHLIIKKELDLDQLLRVLEVLAMVGIVEPGYVGASAGRGFSSVALTKWDKEAAVSYAK